MTKLEARLFNGINLFISISGSVYFVFKYFLSIQSQFGIRPHPQTSFWLSFHVVTVPFFLMIFGYLFHAHALKKIQIKTSSRKLSGYLSIAFFLLMSFSGYALQLGMGPELDKLMGILHLIFSYAWGSISLWHLYAHRFLKKV